MQPEGGVKAKSLLNGRVAIVSGAAHGIGAAEARAICAAGGRVVAGDILDDEGERHRRRPQH